MFAKRVTKLPEAQCRESFDRVLDVGNLLFSDLPSRNRNGLLALHDLASKRIFTGLECQKETRELNRLFYASSENKYSLQIKN